MSIGGTPYSGPDLMDLWRTSRLMSRMLDCELPETIALTWRMGFRHWRFIQRMDTQPGKYRVWRLDPEGNAFLFGIPVELDQRRDLNRVPVELVITGFKHGVVPT